jgi:hypothetical protein
MEQINSAGLIENSTCVGRHFIEVFLKTIERAGTLIDCNDIHKIGLAKLKMRGPATEYLESDSILDSYGDWSDFQARLLERYNDIH